MCTLISILFCVMLWHAASAQQICSASEEGDLRLEQTLLLTTLNAGRLEICRGGQWGSIRADAATSFWSQKNTQVACLQLDFPGALNAVPSIQLSIDDQLSNLDPVHYSAVACDGTEERLTDCEISPVIGDTLHTADVYIVCSPGTVPYTDLHTTFTSSGTEGDMRLVGSQENGVGAVEILTRLGWSTICPDSSWTDEDAEAICQNLGYVTGQSMNFTLNSSMVAPVLVSDARCVPASRSVDISFSQIAAGYCSFLGITLSSVCNESRQAGVSCNSDGVSDQSVRLNRNGVVEILFDGRYGVLCTPLSMFEVGEAMCDGIGRDRSSGSVINISPTLLQQSESRFKPLWISSVSCTPESESLTDCRFDRPIGFGNCLNSDILGVECNSDSESSSDDGGGLSHGAIAGIVLGVLAFLIIVIFCVYGDQNKKKRTRRRAPITTTDASQPLVPPSPPSPPAPEPEPTPAEVTAAEPEDPKLTKAPPPSYKELKKMEEALPPPYVCPQPVSNPAFPPSSGVGNAEYPPATYPPEAVASAPLLAPQSPGAYPPPPPSQPPYLAGGGAAYPPAAQATVYPPSTDLPYPSS